MQQIEYAGGEGVHLEQKTREGPVRNMADAAFYPDQRVLCVGHFEQGRDVEHRCFDELVVDGTVRYRRAVVFI